MAQSNLIQDNPESVPYKKGGLQAGDSDGISAALL